MAATDESRQRWDTDDRFIGVADAGVFADAVHELVQLSRRPGWVAEEPEAHLVPHLQNASVPGVRVLTCDTGEDGVLNVSAENGPSESRRDIRQLAWSLLGHIAEPLASVHEHRSGDAVVFDVITGVASGSAQFATHGHTLRLTVRPAAHSAP
jgi:hypothetical protein